MTNLRRIRKEKKITQAEFARRLNISRSAICQAEKKGIRYAKAAQRYAIILNCGWRELLD